MNIARMFGLGEKRLFTEGQAVEGRATAVKECRWLKVNTKPVRGNGLDGARFPHIVHFSYSIDGKEYKGCRYISWAANGPHVNDSILVYVDRDDPAKYAVKL